MGWQTIPNEYVGKTTSVFNDENSESFIINLKSNLMKINRIVHTSYKVNIL